MLLFLQTALALLANPAAAASDGHLNVYSKPLEKCSTNGMALTGFTRDGTCVEEDDDAGSHHICIDLSSASSSGKNFCQVTEQDNWCAEKDDCAEGGGQCPIQHWCVCQWAFAEYLEQAGGCDSIQTIDCDATNIKAIEAYNEKKGEDESIATAYDCLAKRCKLSETSAWEVSVF